MIRVLLVEPRSSARRELETLLRAAPDIEHLGSLWSGRDAARLAPELEPEVVVSSTALDEPTCFELARYLKLRLPRVKSVLVTDVDREDELYEAVRTGASAYLRRGLAARDLAKAVRRTSRGDYLIDEVVLTHPQVAARVLHEFRELSSAPPDLGPLLAPLSPREIEVLEQIARGNSNKQIARRLSISDQTVKNHISSILRKLAVNDRTQAVVFALRNGWINVEASPQGTGARVR